MIEPEPLFIIGMMVGALTLWFVQTLLRRRSDARPKGVDHATLVEADETRRLREIGELHQRLAVLERLAVDPAARTAAEIEMLR